MPLKNEWHFFLNLLVWGFEVFQRLKISECSLVVVSMDLDTSVFVSLLDFFGFRWIWIIDIVKVYTKAPFCNLRLPN